MKLGAKPGRLEASYWVRSLSRIVLFVNAGVSLELENVERQAVVRPGAGMHA